MTVGYEGIMWVKDQNEAFDFYKNALGMEVVFYHGYEILRLNGANFISIFEAPAEEYNILAQTTFKSSHRLKAGVNLKTEADVYRVTELLTADGGRIISPPGPLPWAEFAADVVDKYGIEWFICMNELAPPQGCLACVPAGEVPGCDLCVRWAEEGYKCPKI